MTPSLLVVGHPLLDLVVLERGEALLDKYKLEPNGATLAGPDHLPIYQEITNGHSPKMIPGGDANAARAAAYILPPDSVYFMGSVGDDDHADILIKANEREGVSNALHVEEGQTTGTCAVIVTGNDRSLVTNLAAAKLFKEAHIDKVHIKALVESSAYLYISGYYLTSGIESAVRLARITEAAGQTIVLNLAAPYIAHTYLNELVRILSFADIVIGNHAEFESWKQARRLQPNASSKHNSSTTLQGGDDLDSLYATMADVASLPSSKPTRRRTIILTRSSDPTLVLTVSDSQELLRSQYKVEAVPTSEIVDTNGAGDVFAGGFVAGLILGKSLGEAVGVGHKMGGLSIREIGAQLPWPKVRLS